MILCLCKVGQWNCIPQCPNSLHLAFETSRIIVPLLLHVKQVQNLSSKSKTYRASPKLDKQVQNLSSKSKACQANSKLVKQVQNLSNKSKTCQESPKLAKQVQNLSSKWRAQIFESERHTLVSTPICLRCIWQNLKLRTI